MKIGILGGGPGGLFLARILKKARPDYLITVYEQNPHGATYGFGVGISMVARDRMREYDPEVFDALQGRSHFNSRQLIRRDEETLLLEYAQPGGAIPRVDLLATLTQACFAVGVNLRFDRRVELDEVERENDIVVAADGAGSSVRSHFSDELGVRNAARTNHFAWFGVARALPTSGLTFLKTEGGIFVGHYYAYANDRSTFLPECDDQTWHRSGFADMTDPQRKAAVEKLFARELQGAPLIENRSIWRTFNAAHCERWRHGKFVLIGDALRVAHFSIGSGTRLAMEDAMALSDAIQQGGTIAQIFERFQSTRQPVRDRFAEAAERSIDWYESLPHRIDLPLIEFVRDFLVRTGRVDDRRLAGYAPSFFRQWQEHVAQNRGQNVGRDEPSHSAKQ